jgi:hypothetical protein
MSSPLAGGMLPLYVFLLLGSFAALGQEDEVAEHKPMIQDEIMMANSHVPTAAEGGIEVPIISTWGMDVDYFFHQRWSVALQADVKLQDFEVEHGQTNLGRSYPVAVSGVAHYHALGHWSFYAGPGIELKK